MLSIIAILSEIPYYFSALIEYVTGADMSAFLDVFSTGFAGVIEFAEKLLGQF